jgi:septal ring factor EnvC (AmiA/AmiB activator)
LPGTNFAQSSGSLKEKRAKILKEIELTEKAMAQARTRESEVLGKLSLVEQQLKLRADAIGNIKQEVQATEKQIDSLTILARGANTQLNKNLVQYRKLARQRLYYRLQGNKGWLYILASNGLEEAFRRSVMMDRLASQQIESARKYKANITLVNEAKLETEKARDELKGMLNLEEKQLQKMDLERQEQANLIRKIQQNAKALEQSLTTQQQQRQKLEKMIADMISKEIAEAEKKAAAEKKAKPPAKKGTPAKSIPEEAPLAAEFAKNKGKLPWPTDPAILVRAYGEQRHKTLKQVTINNTGIDIRSKPEAEVQAVFDGTVSGIQYVPGFAYTVIIQHGAYRTVYSNMSGIKVKKGDKIKRGATVGIAENNPLSGAGEIHFEVWHGKNRQNPSLWLKKS